MRLAAIFFLLFITSTLMGQSKAKMRNLQASRVVAASPALTWQVVADLGQYHRYAPNLDQSSVEMPFSEGATTTERTCSNSDGQWAEKCIITEPDVAYRCQVNTQAPDYPYPFSMVVGYFKVVSDGAGGSRIELEFEYQFASKFQDWMANGLMKRKFGKTVDQLLDNWEAELVRRASIVK